MTNKAIILLSGGLDSVVSLASIINNYSHVFALTFDYGQKSLDAELNASKSICDFYNIPQKIVKIDWLKEISSSALNSDNLLPQLKEAELDNIEKTKDSAKSVWIPNRNALFINIAACFAEAKGFDDIIIGANKEEGETFIDNSKEFINNANKLLETSVNSKIRVIAPLIDKNKDEIVKTGIERNVPFNLIFSCYNSGNKHCGVCESCLRLKRALKNCGRTDIIYNIFG